MGKILTQEINRFDGGFSNDKSVSTANKFAACKHFDAFTYPTKLVPRPRTISTGEDKTLKLVKFLYAPSVSTSSGYALFGLGVASGAANTKPAVYYYDIDAAGAVSWGTPANNEGNANGRDTETFEYYKQYIYMWQLNAGTAKLCRFDTSGGAFNNAYQTISSTTSTFAAPVHHPSDDVLYFFTDNRVHTLNNTVFSADALQLPTNMRITSACAYNNYLAIACVTKGNLDVRSIVFLWDRDSSLTTLTDRYDFGEGEIMHLATLDTKLTAVMGYYPNNIYSAGSGKVILKQAVGNIGLPVGEEITSSSLTFSMPKTRMVRDNKLYFPVNITHDGTSLHGIWVVDGSGRLSVDYVEEEATSYEGIYATGNVWWIAHSGDGSVNYTYQNAGTPGYSATLASTYDTLSMNLGSSNVLKKLLSVSLSHEPLDGTVTVKYKKDDDADWTTIFINSTANSLSHTAVNIESTGVTLPEYRDIQFRVEWTGGGLNIANVCGITGLKFISELIDKDN